MEKTLDNGIKYVLEKTEFDMKNNTDSGVATNSPLYLSMLDDIMSEHIHAYANGDVDLCYELLEHFGF